MTYSNSPVRSSEAHSIEEDIANGECRDRTLWIYVSYNWETRKKAVFLLDDETALAKELDDGHKWLRLYKVQVGLPFPAIADSRTVIELKSESMWEELDHKKPEESVLYTFARRLFLKAVQALPAPWRPVESHWIGGMEHNSMQFTVLREDVKLKVTVEDIT